MKPKIDWMTKRDYPYVLEIEKECYCDPWDEETLSKCLRTRNSIGMTVRVGEDIVGYFIYQLCDGYYTLVNMTVHPGWQRCGLGRAMMDSLKSKLAHHRRTHIRMAVSDRCENAHYFLRSMGFKATGVERNYFKVDGQYEDAYHFEYRFGKPYRHGRRKKVQCVENEMGAKQ